MRKIPTLFQRNYATDFLVRDEYVPGTEWVNNEGYASQKFDGTACLIQTNRLYKRYVLRHVGLQMPQGFLPAQECPDPITGELPGWIPVEGGPEDRWHREAWEDLHQHDRRPYDGTFELVGPKIQGNPQGLRFHRLWRHGSALLPSCPRSYGEIKKYLAVKAIEGIVWHHGDGRMCKIKRKDFGFPWPVTDSSLKAEAYR